MSTLPAESVATLTLRLEALYAKVGAFFAGVAARYGEGQITCHDGCDTCCQAGLSVTGLEASLIRAHLARLSAPERAAVTAPSGRPGCPALDAQGRCRIYPVRPLVCRAHGLPLRFREAKGKSLPMIDACPKNFTGVDLEAIDAASVLDQATLSTILLALAAAYADLERRPRDERVPIAELLDPGAISGGISRA